MTKYKNDVLKQKFKRKNHANEENVKRIQRTKTTTEERQSLQIGNSLSEVQLFL